MKNNTLRQPPYSPAYLANLTRFLGCAYLVYQEATANALQARYVYDAWGNHKVLNPNGTVNNSDTFIGNINPLRYRGYYYDADLGLYYLMTRYYDPAACRFISADGIEYLDPETIGGLNLFAYCNNNPVMGVDPDGTSWLEKLKSNLDNAKTRIISFISNVISAGTRIVDTTEHVDYILPFIIKSGTRIVAEIGDTTKPLSVFSTISTDIKRFWDTNVGIQLNFQHFCYSLSMNFFESQFSLRIGSQQYSFVAGIDKIGFEFATCADGVEVYQGYYIHTASLAAICVVAVAVATVPAVGIPAAAALFAAFA